jgi:hypothetical protein
MKSPYELLFNKIGNPSQGYISIGESSKNIPFEVKRIFYTYYTPEEVVRGRHAHYDTEMILIAVSGRIVVNTEMPNGERSVFVLDKPEIGLYLPKLCWHTMQYSHNAVQLVIASTHYAESDYIRSYDEFLKLNQN